MSVLRLFGELWFAFVGRRCPECKVRPGRKHETACRLGAWDGGTWA